MSFTIAPIVEGHGDVMAVPALLRRMAPELIVKRPVRFPRSRLLQDPHLERAGRIAASNIAERGAVLLLIDADDDCAATAAAELQRRLTAKLPDRQCRVALAVREFESWIVGGDPAYGVNDADATGGVKGRIKEHLGVYGETADQARLIARVDLVHLAQRSRSFRHLQKIVAEFAVLAHAGD